MILITIIAVLGILTGFQIYRTRREKAEKGFTLGWIIWRASFIPIYLLIVYSLLQSGGIVSIIFVFLLSVLLALYLLVFRPWEDIRDYRQQG